MSDTTSSFDDSVQRVFEKRILRKLDWHILPPVTMLCLVSFLDRANIGNAKIAGLEKDLQLTGTQFNTALSVFFTTYALSELPSNIILKKVKPNRLLGFLIAGWGIVTTLTGLIQNFAGLVATRFFLGIFEGGLTPGVVLYLSCIYKRHELQTRIGIFYAAVPFSGAFGGLFASAILLMDGVGGVAGWKWLFILEGIATFFLAITTIFVLPSDLESAKFLTKEEKNYALWRLNQDGGVPSTPKKPTKGAPEDASAGSRASEKDEDVEAVLEPRDFTPEQEEFEWREVRRGLFDVLTWLNGLSFFGLVTSLNSFSLFFPSIVAGLGYSGYEAQLHTVPPYVLAAFLTVAVSILSDHMKLRGPFVMVLLPLTIMGYVIAVTAKTNAVRYVGACFIAAGTSASVPCIITCVANNSSGHYKRATATAVQVGFASAGGLAATFIYTPDQAPKYKKGHTICLALVAFAWVMAAGHVLYCLWENKARREGRRDSNITKYQTLREAGLTRAQIGDRHPNFKFTL